MFFFIFFFAGFVATFIRMMSYPLSLLIIMMRAPIIFLLIYDLVRVGVLCFLFPCGFIFHPVTIVGFIALLLHFTLALFLYFSFRFVGLFKLSNLGIGCHYFLFLRGQQSPFVHLYFVSARFISSCVSTFPCDEIIV